MAATAAAEAASLLTTSALLTTPTPPPKQVVCPAQGNHSSYTCPATKICCGTECCDPGPNLTVGAAAMMVMLFGLLLTGALVVWWLQWRPKRGPGGRSQLLAAEAGTEGEGDVEGDGESEGSRDAIATVRPTTYSY